VPKEKNLCWHNYFLSINFYSWPGWSLLFPISSNFTIVSLWLGVKLEEREAMGNRRPAVPAPILAHIFSFYFQTNTLSDLTFENKSMCARMCGEARAWWPEVNK